jgi:hypothetical protein
MSDVHEDVAVEDLKEGDLIDLENDEFADPFGHCGYTDLPEEGTNRDILRGWHDYEEDHELLGFEYASVESAVTDKPDPEGRVGVIVYTDLMNVRFPLGHTVKRYLPDVEEGMAKLVVDGQDWQDGDGATIFLAREAHDLATRVRDQGYTDVKVEYIDD